MSTSERSQFPSIKLDQLVYVELESGNGGMMLSVSEEGFSFRAVTPVRPNGKIHFSFLINDSDKLEGFGNIEWTEDDGKVAGLQFAELTPQFQQSLRRWLSQLSAPEVPTFSASHSDNLNFGPSVLDPKISEHPPSAPNVEPRAELRSTFPQTLRDAVESPSNLVGDSPRQVLRNNVRPTLPALSAFDYSGELQESSRPRRNAVATIAVVVCVVALGVLLYGYRDFVGQYLISLGQKMSPAPQATSTQPATAQPAAQSPSAKPASDSSQSLTTANAQETPRQSVSDPSSASAAPALSAPSAAKTEAATPNKPPAETQFVDVPRNLSPDAQARSLWSAVAQGNTAAEVALAKLYLIGGGVTKNCDQARVLLQAAAKKGNGEAIDKLSQLQSQGCP
jgi:hypothetical protein